VGREDAVQSMTRQTYGQTSLSLAALKLSATQLAEQENDYILLMPASITFLQQRPFNGL